jgi:hypothetical protein
LYYSALFVWVYGLLHSNWMGYYAAERKPVFIVLMPKLPWNLSLAAHFDGTWGKNWAARLKCNQRSNWTLGRFLWRWGLLWTFSYLSSFGMAQLAFSPGILHELKNTYRHVFRFNLTTSLRTENLLQFPFSFSLLICELLSFIISNSVGHNLISKLRTAAHEDCLGQMLRKWTGLIWLRTGKVLGSGTTVMNFRFP